jgi:5-methylcytosine-specific restriction endonuclease McrA
MAEKPEVDAAVSAKLRWQVLERDGHRCTSCGRTPSDGAKLHADHLLPRSKGGRTTLDNLATKCSRCNLGKGAELEHEA